MPGGRCLAQLKRCGVGQCNIDLSADNVKECSEAIIRKKLKVRIATVPLFRDLVLPLTSRDATRCPLLLTSFFPTHQVAGGADYDTGANAAGYKSNAGEIRRKAMEAYGKKEKEGNITSVRATRLRTQQLRDVACLLACLLALFPCRLTIGRQVRYVTSALPATTPVDLNGRKMVAPPTEARR